MIQSFTCAETQALFEGRSARRFANFRAVAERKLLMLDTAASLNALRSPPGDTAPLDRARAEGRLRDIDAGHDLTITEPEK